jgi:formate-dependent nitrite reductase membrane component NrfD
MAYERRWETRRRGGRSAGDEARESYYGVPVIHRAPWRWEIPTYFFLGGIAGASYVIAGIAHVFGGDEERPVVRTGRYLSLAALIPSPILLILDLGRPERFHHMLRVFKFRSPMSVGTWGLVVFGAFSTLSALIQAAEDGLFGRGTLVARLLLRLPSRAIAFLGQFPAFFVSGYTGVLLAATAVPLWTKNYLLMGPLFIASALSNALAAITLILTAAGRASHRSLRRLERFETAVMGVEALLLAALRLNSGKTIARPMHEGRLGRIYRVGVLGTGLGLPLLIQAPGAWLGRRLPRGVTALAALLTLIGGALFRYLIVTAGHRSADDPQATFELTRARENGSRRS